MPSKHTLWTARVDAGGTQTRLEKRIVPLPWGLSLNPKCELQTPIPAVPPAEYDGPPLLYCQAGNPMDAYEQVVSVLERLLIEPDEGNTVPMEDVVAIIERWVSQYTTCSAPNINEIGRLLEYDVERIHTQEGVQYRYRDISLERNVWIFHAAQQHVTPHAD